MKTNLFLLFFVLLLASSKTSMAKEAVQVDSLLTNIQLKVFNAFIADISRNASELPTLKAQLKEHPNQDRLVSYWRSYLQFYSTIVHVQQGDRVKAKAAAEAGIKLLNGIADKTSEEYTLLARLESMTLQFAGMQVAAQSKKMSDNIQRALQLDPDNLRANLVYGSIDYYTPAEFGGGKNAEKYLLRAIELPDQNSDHPYAPTWGKDEAYELLINLYIRNKADDKAKSYFEEAVKKYPNNYQIQALKDKIAK